MWTGYLYEAGSGGRGCVVLWIFMYNNNKKGKRRGGLQSTREFTAPRLPTPFSTH